MKKKSIFFLALFVLLIFSISLILIWTRAKKIKDRENKIYSEINKTKQYILENTEKNNIKIYMTKLGKVVDMNLNEYLLGVLPAEMPPTFGLEALKAQAVVARTYALEKRNSSSHEQGEICDNYAHCQAYLSEEQIQRAWKNRGFTEEEIKKYKEKIKEAVYSTSGEVITYDNKYIKAYFHANSGGKTEDVSSIWGKQNIPYLKSVKSQGEDKSSNYKSSNSFKISDVISKLNNNTTSRCTSTDIEKEGIQILTYTKSGRVNNIKIGKNIYSAEKLRMILSLKSTNFTVEMNNNTITFNVLGYGHGVGMSQNGADYMSSIGKKYEEIIKHYYTGVTLTKINTESI